MSGVYFHPEFVALQRSYLAGDCPPEILSDWLEERGVPPEKCGEAVRPPSVGKYFPRHYYNENEFGIGSGIGSGSGSGIGIGSGSGSGSGIGIGSANSEVILERGKVYLITTVDWFSWVGRMVEQIGPWEYRFESVSKIHETNDGDNWEKLCAGDESARKKATYRHYKTPVFLGMGVVAKVEWVGGTPQEEGYPG